MEQDREMGSFSWTSTTALADEEFVENDGRNSPCGSESDQVVSTGKEDENSGDEEETDVSVFSSKKLATPLENYFEKSLMAII